MGRFKGNLFFVLLRMGSKISCTVEVLVFKNLISLLRETGVDE